MKVESYLKFIIMENIPANDQLRKLYDYFVEQWLENLTFERYIMWNRHQRRHRMNNIVEGWHFK